MNLERKICRNCGSTEFYTREVRFEGHAKAALPNGGIFDSTECRVYVCGGCGLVEWYVTGESLDDVKKDFERKL